MKVKNIVIFMLLSILILFLVSCEPKLETNEKPHKENEITPEKEVKVNNPQFEDDPVLATAGDYQITESKLMKTIPALKEGQMVLNNKDLFKNTLKTMLEEEILNDKAVELGYEQDVDYQLEVDRLQKEFEIQKKQALIRIMFTKEIDKKYKFDETALKNFYKTNKFKYEKRVFSEILRVVKNPNDEQEKKKVEKEIEMIYQKLKAGEKFEDLAREYYNGFDPYRENGGKIGLIRRGKYPIEFEEIGYDKLKKVGDISKPFLYNQGWAIIRLDKIYGFEDQEEFIRKEYERIQRTNINRELADQYLNPLKFPVRFNDIEIEKIIYSINENR